jgi:hypothetical protein
LATGLGDGQLRASAWLLARLGDGAAHGEADTLDRLGDAYRTAGDLAAAHRTWQLALEIVETVNPGEVPRIRAKLG